MIARILLLPTAREGNAFTGVSFCPQSASWLLVHCSSLLRHGRYASYWNVFLFNKIITLGWAFRNKLALLHTRNMFQMKSDIHLLFFLCFPEIFPIQKDVCRYLLQRALDWTFSGNKCKMSLLKPQDESKRNSKFVRVDLC